MDKSWTLEVLVGAIIQSTEYSEGNIVLCSPLLYSMINAIKNLLRSILGHRWSPYYTGVDKDPRSEEEQKKDYAHEERLVTAPDQIWFTKITQSPYPIENQYGTSSCVPHGVTLGLGIAYKTSKQWFVRFSKMYVYRQRSNYPQQGMSPWECFEILRKQGSCLFDTMPTPTTESAANALTIPESARTEAKIFDEAEYYSFTTSSKNDINELATAAAHGYAIPITIYASYREWAQLYPQLWDNPSIDKAEVKHEVCILPRGGFIENGIKYVTVQDSAWFGSIQIRHLSEAFIRQRVYDARYWTTVSMQAGIGTKPKYVFTKNLSIGMKSPDVKALQQCLIYEGLLPSDCATGLFAGRTFAAVRAFQEKYESEILTPNGLTAPTGLVGPATIKKLNALYGS